MRFLKLAVLLPLWMLSGCVHINEGSRSANLEQIRAHLKGQLHCQTLELLKGSKNNFSGAGRNETGEFTITVTREKERITFHGIYTGHAQGTFSGSSTWSRHLNSGFGVHKSKESVQDSLGTP